MSFEIEEGDVLTMDGGTKRIVDEVTDNGYGGFICRTDFNQEWVIFETREEAGEAARQYWEDLAQDDPKEFAAIVGEETLVAWGLRQYGGPGSTQVRSLEEWLNLWLDTPEEQWAGFDGDELSCVLTKMEPADDEDDDPVAGETFECVAYRNN